jgi:hypothetical protein
MRVAGRGEQRDPAENRERERERESRESRGWGWLECESGAIIRPQTAD